MLILYTQLILGLILISFAASSFINHCINIAKFYKLSDFFIGATLVALGTSVTEIFVACYASFNNNVDLAMGNVVGSNIANMLLVLGITSFFSSIKIKEKTFKKDIPLLLLVTAIVWLLLSNSYLSYLDGVILLFVLFVYLFTISDKEIIQHTVSNINIKKSSILGITSLFLLLFSTHLIVNSAVKIAIYMEVSELLIGLTIVAIGTSLPEIATCCSAALKKQHNLVIGNIIGSNFFNLLTVIPVSAFISPGKIDENIVNMDIPVVMLATLLPFALSYRKKEISNKIGCFIILMYFLYIYSLIF